MIAIGSGSFNALTGPGRLIPRPRLGSLSTTTLERRRPRFLLGEGRLSQPNLSPEAQSRISSAVDSLLDGLDSQISSVYQEEQLIELDTLTQNPESYAELPYIGGWTPEEVATQLTLDATTLKGIADRVASGTVAPYLSSAQLTKAQNLSSQAARLINILSQAPSSPVPSGSDSQAHLETHVGSLDQALSSIERGIVTAEAGSVPVIEPYEKSASVDAALLIGGGILAVIIGIVFFAKG